jgi:hypothetical protein
MSTSKKYYKANKERIKRKVKLYRQQNIMKVRQSQKRRYIVLRQWYYEMKNLPCEDCHKLFPHWIMEFDHVPERGPKLFNIMIGRLAGSLLKLLIELMKCDLICSNCHANRTYKRSVSGKYLR